MLLCSEIAVAVVVRVDDNLLDDDFRVYHDEFQAMLAGSGIGEFYLQPAKVVEHLIATEHFSSVLPTAEQQVVMWRQGLQILRLVEELIPEASEGQHSNLSTIGFAIGFVLMMVLDVVMG